MPKPSPPRPPGSSRLGIANTCARSSQSSRASSSSLPVNVTQSATSSDAAIASSSPRREPSPTTTQRASGTRARTSSGRRSVGRGHAPWSLEGRLPVRRDGRYRGAVYRAGNVEGRGGGVHDLVGGPTGRAPREWSALLRLTKGTSLEHPPKLFGGNLDEVVRQLAKLSGDGVERGARYGDEDPAQAVGMDDRGTRAASGASDLRAAQHHLGHSDRRVPRVQAQASGRSANGMNVDAPLTRHVRERAGGTGEPRDHLRRHPVDQRQQRVLRAADEAGVIDEQDPHRFRVSTVSSSAWVCAPVSVPDRK